jgi:serine/threonine-protein kinase TNNI3K
MDAPASGSNLTVLGSEGCGVKVANLMEELGRRRDLKETYKAQLESTQGYLRFYLMRDRRARPVHMTSPLSRP